MYRCTFRPDRTYSEQLISPTISLMVENLTLKTSGPDRMAGNSLRIMLTKMGKVKFKEGEKHLHYKGEFPFQPWC